jgi:ribosomal protein S18 acetylase RimI-like enzyme
MTISLALRPVTAPDRPLLVDLYAETRAAELALTPWSSEQRRAFVEMQFTAQDGDYRRRFANASFDVILANGRPVGRLYVDRRADSIHILDVIVAPEERGQGIGTGLLRELMDEAAATGRRVSLYVDTLSRARAWYDRLGFVPGDEPGMYLFMTWERS